MSKITIFGGSGFLGSYVADELTSRGHEVLVADIRPSKYLKKKQQFLACDIMEPGSFKSDVIGSSIVYNFAGFADLDEALAYPRETIEQNILGNLNILESCKSMKIKRFVYASSAYALSKKGGIYGVSKLASEKIVEHYSHTHGVPYTVIRYGSLYGERANPSNWVFKMLKDALVQGKMCHQGDGEEVREYIHASDAAVLSADIIESNEFLNSYAILTGSEKTRQKDVLRMIQEIMDRNVTISYNNNKRESHYDVTPYSYQPNLAKKLVLNSYIDLGQGIVGCLKHLDEES